MDGARAASQFRDGAYFPEGRSLTNGDGLRLQQLLQLPWATLGSLGYPWPPFWLPLATLGYTWLPLPTLGYPSLPLATLGYP